MSRLIEKTISSAYDIIRHTHIQSIGSISAVGIDAMDTTDTPVNRSFVDLPKELFQMLATVGAYLYRDTVLLQKVLCCLFLALAHRHEHTNKCSLQFIVGVFVRRYVEC